MGKQYRSRFQETEVYDVNGGRLCSPETCERANKSTSHGRFVREMSLSQAESLTVSVLKTAVLASPRQSLIVTTSRTPSSGTRHSQDWHDSPPFASSWMPRRYLAREPHRSHLVWAVSAQPSGPRGWWLLKPSATPNLQLR